MSGKGDHLVKALRRAEQIMVIFTPEKDQYRDREHDIAAQQRSGERERLQASSQHSPSELSCIGRYAVLATPLIFKIGRCRNWTRQMIGVGLPGMNRQAAETVAANPCKSHDRETDRSRLP